MIKYKDNMDYYAPEVAVQNKMPLVEAMLKYKNDKVYPFHTPGHKGGRGMEALLKNELGAGAVAMDVSLMSELDDIHAPSGCIKEAQDLAAQLYGSDKCFFAVNGTTGAIHAMLLAACRAGDKVLVPRNAHRSVAGALLLANLEPVFVMPEYDAAFGINTQITPQAVAQAFARHADIKAVLVTSPNYYGQAADLRAIAEITHAHNTVLLVDEAHGPQLGFSSKLPPSALQCGADASAQSTHKILGAMTQCSLLHFKGGRIDLARAAEAVSLLTTTSPNYLLMASIDAARYTLAMQGEMLIDKALTAAGKLRAVLSEFDGLRLLDSNCIGKNGVAGFDPAKVTVNTAAWGYTGVEVGDALRQAGVAVELTDAANVLFLVTFADGGADYDAVLAKIHNVVAELEQHKRAPLPEQNSYKLPDFTTAMPLRQAFDAQTESIALELAEGRICAEQVSFYPPGIPVLWPGELITPGVIDYCRRMKALGLPVSGPADYTLTELRVIK